MSEKPVALHAIRARLTDQFPERIYVGKDYTIADLQSDLDYLLSLGPDERIASAMLEFDIGLSVWPSSHPDVNCRYLLRAQYALMGDDDEEPIERLEDEADLCAAKKARADVEKHGTVSLTSITKGLGE